MINRLLTRRHCKKIGLAMKVAYSVFKECQQTNFDQKLTILSRLCFDGALTVTK